MGDEDKGVEYRDVPGFPGYRAGSDGSVWSCLISSGKLTSHWRRRKTILSSTGYGWLTLWRKRKKKSYHVHQVIAFAFLGPRPQGLCVNHKDGNKLNNLPSNLEYVTFKENMQHALRTGLRKNHRRGSDNPASRHTEEQIRTVLLLEGTATQRAIARLVGMNYRQVNNVLRGRTWKHVTGR